MTGQVLGTGSGLKQRIAKGAICAGLFALAMPAPAMAQDNRRLDRLEQQISALQRAVFPGGDDRFFEPEIRPDANNGATPSPQVTTSALTGVLARLDAIEAQLARLTAATEVNENALSTLERRLASLESGAAQPTLATAAPAATPAPTTAPPPPPPANTGSRASGVIEVPTGNRNAAPPPAAAPAPSAPQAGGPSAARLAAVQAIVKPATGDAGEDEYTYGFRLWDAGFYPEAQQQLALYLEQHPGHRLNSRGRNLLGRAFLDAGEPRAAATHFFENYQTDNQSERAPDSLLYLAESMIQLGDTSRACIALAEFGDTYPALAVGRLQSMYGGLTGRVDCT